MILFLNFISFIIKDLVFFRLVISIALSFFDSCHDIHALNHALAKDEPQGPSNRESVAGVKLVRPDVGANR